MQPVSQFVQIDEAFLAEGLTPAPPARRIPFADIAHTRQFGGLGFRTGCCHESICKYVEHFFGPFSLYFAALILANFLQICDSIRNS